MSFSRQEVKALARLARLSLTPDEQALFARQLADIVEYARQVSDVPTQGTSEDGAPTAATPLREDVVEPPLDRLDVIGPAPSSDDAAGLIKVPRVLG